MPKNKVSDLITHQEIAFAHLILSGTMTDRAAAEAAGLNPDTAAYTKSTPRVRAYMIEHRAAAQQQLVEQESEGLRQQNLGRERVLARLWEIANLSPEMTRGSIAGQVKALSMIVAIEGLIPDRRANSSQKKSTPPLPPADIYEAAWLRKQQGQTIDPPPGPSLVHEHDQPGLSQPENIPGSVGDAPAPPGPIPVFDPSQSAFANHVSSAETTSWVPDAFASATTPDTRSPFSIRRNGSPRRR